MASTAAAATAAGNIDYDNINWRQLGDFQHFTYTIFDVDPEREIADFALRFVPDERIFLHRHRAETHTFVAQGEHILFEPEGPVKEVRPLGSYTRAAASHDPHAEGGGREGAVVVYNTRGSDDGIVFDVLDDEQNTVGTLSVSDLNALFDAQGRKPGA